MTLASDNSAHSFDKDNPANPDRVVTVDNTTAPFVDARNFDNKSTLIDAKAFKFRHPSNRNELASYYLHFMGPKPFYKTYSYV